MTKEQLFEKLELESPIDFNYFEQMAELLECDEEISFDDFFSAISMLDGETAQSLIENYFEDFNGSIPDSDDEFVMMIESLKQNLILACSDIENTRRQFAELLYAFRQWMHEKSGAVVDGMPCTIIDALAEHRVEKLGGSSHKYEFPSVSKFEMEDISLSLGKYSKVDILKEEDEDYSEDFCN